ncbi:hypothetical protein EWH70_19935 [Amycolatopsis suaedae]|uniref:DUF559 domain-containing protein n=2 Tax=Amycolatopsis suaedae TaxID=2510978 RepID=A0A4V2ELS2_9PSEU|nr:hypothetical protein EWH70_19935 [Amycolatopsis suaedae]
MQLSNSEPNERQCTRAALLKGKTGSMITGLWAARRYGLRRLPEPRLVHLLAPASREVTSVGFVLIERTTRLPNPTFRNGVPLAPVVRAVLDGVRRLRDIDAIRALLAEAVQRGYARLEDLIEELNLGSQRGSALPRRALREMVGGARSVAEIDATTVWEMAGLPQALWNVKVFDSDGVHVATPDAWCEEVALAWEIDSKEFHLSPADYARTLERNARYAAAGVVVVQTLPSRLRTEPAAVAAELRAAYEAAKARPRPAVHLR